MDMIKNYLIKVENGIIRPNNNIMFKLQVSNLFKDIFNLIPNLSEQDLINAFSVQNNDSMFTVYIGSLVRSTIALHDLINNRAEMKEIEVLEKKDKEIEVKNWNLISITGDR